MSKYYIHQLVEGTSARVYEPEGYRTDSGCTPDQFVVIRHEHYTGPKHARYVSKSEKLSSCLDSIKGTPFNVASRGESIAAGALFGLIGIAAIFFSV